MRRYGWVIAALVVVLVGGAAVNEWYRALRPPAPPSPATRCAPRSPMPDAAARAAALGAFADATPDAAVAARFAEAGSLAQPATPTAAAAVLAEVAEDGDVPELYRSLAALQRDDGARQGDARGRAAGRRSTRSPAPDAPFRPLALEQRALMRLETGDNAAAIADLETVLAEPTATEALQGRARQLIIAAGGTLPLPPTAAPVTGSTGQPAPSVPADG